MVELPALQSFCPERELLVGVSVEKLVSAGLQTPFIGVLDHPPPPPPPPPVVVCFGVVTQRISDGSEVFHAISFVLI